jgi:Tfp pilus assembly protein PilV
MHKRYNERMRIAKERGFTVIEFVVASMFIGIVVLALYSMFLGIKQVDRTTNDYTTATSVAQQLMEEYRDIPYSGIAVGTVDDTSSALGPYPNLLSPRSATVDVTQVNASGIKQVDVTVSWTDRTGYKTIHMTTQVADIGLNH